MKIIFLITIISFFGFLSCAKDFYQVPVSQGNIISLSMLSKLEIGLTKAQVKYIMGTPSVNDPFNAERWDYIGYETVGDKKISEVHHVLFFENNKLAKWEKRLEVITNQILNQEIE